MRDGKTVRSPSAGGKQSGWSATLVQIAGGAEGSEYPLDAERVVVGRGPDVDLAFTDDRMSAQHAAFEQIGGVFSVTDLESTNGVRVNGETVATRALAHGDRVELGAHVFELVLEKREKPPRTWVVDA
ncbi:MAG: FHA domain-containing protein [Myxococcota bacterium]